MRPAPGISERWIKASVIGTIWAASEIVLGSFFHNLRIPFSSNILTGIGIIIMISAAYRWTENGLFWRAGLICAVMKTMSPSAVIFGPMIAIFMQALLLDISVRTFRRAIPGFIIGSMLATSWNLFQKIINFIVFYGFNIVDIYTDLLLYTQKQLNIHFNIVWLPVLFLLLVYGLMGFVSALVGIRVGRKLLSHPPEMIQSGQSAMLPGSKRFGKPFNYSVSWLVADFLLITAVLLSITHTPVLVWSVATIVLVLVWISRYKRALRQLSRPRFWLSFVLITMLTAFVLNKMQSRDYVHGLLVGMQMNFRAVVIILGFSVLGTELYNPRIRNFFLKTPFRQLPLALELSFESLPVMIASIPEYKVLVRDPVSVFYRLISQIEFRLAALKQRLARKIFIVAGGVGTGKTRLLLRLVDKLRAENMPVSGILSPRLMENGLTTGYDLIDISTGNRERFLRISDDPDQEKIGRYSILPGGLSLGINALKGAEAENSGIVVIDEVGKMEMENRGWAGQLTALLHAASQTLILSVRDVNVEAVIRHWHLRNYVVFELPETDSEMIIGRIVHEVQTGQE
ncbi:MAG TPA: nucleoside-triphosphatase [Bacteroidales bacterium]|nr:nucleoside-triphosphatase [Bacteroidales bacterium]HSA42844.1 nucleoside-triphosphatase [Bacteroidales bacterium]